MTNDVEMKKSAPKKRKKIASLDRRKARAGWFFILPFLIGFVLVYLPMIFQSIQLSFSTMLVGGTDTSLKLTWVGIQNYQEALFVDAKFVQTLLSGLGNLAFEVPAILIFSLFMAVMLNQKMAGRAVFRSIFFIPVILSTGIMETIASADVLNDYMDSSEGIDDGSGQSTSDQLVSAMDFTVLFANMKVGTELIEYVVTALNNIYGIVNRAGVQLLIFLAALQGVSPAIYEACKIDGATSWETFWKVTFPIISPMILVNGVYTIIDSFTTDSNPVMSYIAEVYKLYSERSTAMAWMYFLIVMLVVAVIAAIFSAFVFYQRKND